MKETPIDGAEYGLRIPSDGWHRVVIGEPIDFLPGKGGEGFWQDDRTGKQAYKIPVKIDDDGDPDNHGINIDQIVVIDRDNRKLANICLAVGIWDAILKKFPGDISIFDTPVMNGIKVSLPGKSFMMKTEVNKDGTRANMKQSASMAKYKELAASEKKTAPDKKAPVAPANEPALADDDPWK